MEAIKIQIDEQHLATVVERAVTLALDKTKKNVLTKKEAAKYLGISHVTLWKLEKAMVIRPISLGEREVYTRGDLDKFLDAARAKADAAAA